MNTGSADERKLLADVARMAKAQERIADALELLLTSKLDVELEYYETRDDERKVFGTIRRSTEDDPDCEGFGPETTEGTVTDVDPRKRFVVVELTPSTFAIIDLARQASLGVAPDREAAEFKVEQLVKTWTEGERS